MVDLKHLDDPDQTQKGNIEKLRQKKRRDHDGCNPRVGISKFFVWNIDIDGTQDKLNQEKTTKKEFNLMNEFPRVLGDDDHLSTCHNGEANNIHQKDTDDEQDFIKDKVLLITGVKRAVNDVHDLLKAFLWSNMFCIHVSYDKR